MKKIEYYQFMQWDGGERHIPKEPCFSNKSDADAFLDDNKHSHFDKRTVYVFDSIDEYNATKSKELRDQALSKLTELEKKALGLI